ncbi:MAG: VWA domain-containing protein [Anaerolineae bacterium]|nr:VWA domain-containing protein [Anaerolineae bacterium]
MGTSVKQWLGSLLQRTREKLQRPQRGQSLVIVILAMIGILALVGLSVDLGLVYVERVRVGRAADAAALAAVVELPAETAAHERAKVYLMENGYNPDGPGVRLLVDGAYVSGPSEEDANTILWIDTAFSRSTEGAANRIRVRVKQWVPMTFLQFIGFRRIPVEGSAEAENINNLDVVIVYDKSGSMEFDTLCYGCWDPWGTDVPSTSVGDCNSTDGCLYPLKWSKTSATATANHCRTGNLYDSNYRDTVSGAYFTWMDEYYRRNSDGRYFIVIEAEEYSYYDTRADYHSWQYSPYRSFWVMQRNYYNFDASRYVGALGRDSRGAYVSHHPWPHPASWTGYGMSCRWDDVTSAGHDGNGPYCNSTDSRVIDYGGPFPAPRVDYEFTAPSSSTYYFWIRGQGGDRDEHIFWGVQAGSALRYPTGQETGFQTGASYDAARTDRWDWERLSLGQSGSGGDGIPLTAGQKYVLSFWGGGAGFDIDRIVITNDSYQYGEDNDSTDNGNYLPLKNAVANNARTGWACERCDPRFAGHPGGELVDMDPGSGEDWWYLPDCSVGANPDQRLDPIYKGELPIRDALKSAINFVDRMDFSLDQVGYVDYDGSPHTRDELECLRRRGPETLTDPTCNPSWSDPGEEPPTDPDCGCFDSTIDNSVIYELNSTFSSGSTNMAGGMRNGIEVLSTASGHYGRPGAAHIMVLMTDGVANKYPHDYGDPVCYNIDGREWPGGSAAQDCVIYYAHEARDNGIVIYTISLGYSADLEIMQAVADITGGEHRWAPSPDKLNDIFDELFERIFVRLTD